MDSTNQREQQMQMQKLVHAKNSRMAEMFEQILNSEIFPMDRLSQEWKWKAAIAIRKATPLSQKISLREFAVVVEADMDNAITLFQFGVLSNSLEAVSVDDLSFCSPTDYKTFIDEAVSHIEWYQKRISEIRKKIELDVEAEFMMKTASEKGLKIAQA